MMNSRLRKITSVFLTAMLLFLTVGAEFSHSNCFSTNKGAPLAFENGQKESAPESTEFGTLCAACFFHSEQTAMVSSEHSLDASSSDGTIGVIVTFIHSACSSFHFALRAPPKRLA